MTKELAKFLLALEKTLREKHQLLPYLRGQIISETYSNIDKITDEEIEVYLRLK